MIKFDQLTIVFDFGRCKINNNVNYDSDNSMAYDYNNTFKITRDITTISAKRR